MMLQKDKNKAVFFFIFTLLVILRLAAFGQIPGGLNQDGAMAAVEAKTLAEYGTDRFGVFMPAHFRGWIGAQMNTFLSYTMIPFIKILGFNIIAIRLPILLVSILGAVAVYGIVKKVFGTKTALAALLLTAVNPWHFMQSRWALESNMFPHMFIIGFYFLISGFADLRVTYMYISMVFFALSMYCYGVAFYMVPFFLLASCVLLLWHKRVTWKQTFLCAAVYFGISWPIYGTMFINFMKWETVRLPFVTMEFFEQSTRSADILFFSYHRKAQLLKNAISLLNVAFLQRGDGLPWNSIGQFGAMYKIAVPFMLIGVLVTAKKALKEEDKIKQIACQILMTYWGFAIMEGLIINEVNVNRINVIFYSHIIFLTVGIAYAIHWISGYFNEKVKIERSLVVAVTILFAAQSTLFFHTYFTDWANAIEKAFYADFMDAMEYANDFENGQYYITPDTQYEGSVHVSEILTLFAFDVDARYWRGETDVWRGMEIPYPERIIYANPDTLEEMPEAVYVIKTVDANLFEGKEFSLTYFGDYAVAVPKKEAANAS